MSHEDLDDFLALHTKKQEEYNGFSCDICGKMGSGRTDIARHIEAVHVITAPFHCLLCSKSYKTRDSLRKHNSKCSG